MLVVDAGDSVLFKATHPGHDSASLDGMLPAGAASWKGKFNKDVEVKMDVPGFYGYVCTPHAVLGMFRQGRRCQSRTKKCRRNSAHVMFLTLKS